MTSRIGNPDTDTDIALRQRLEESDSRHFLMIAGAGSGKTTSLVKALAHVEKSQGKRLRQNGQKVACITYTEVAVEEINGDVGNDPLFHISTIHSFLWSLIKPFQSDLQKWVHDRLDEKVAEEQEKLANPRTQQKTKDRAEIRIDRYRRQQDEVRDVTNFRYGVGSDYSDGVLGHGDILRIGPEFIRSQELMRRVLVRRFPVIFVDESQDTDPRFVEAALALAREVRNEFCIGFFGDPVQQIYPQGVGAIPLEEGWMRLEKPENFRCPQMVLSVINCIRSGADGLVQTRGRQEIKDGELTPVVGTARVLILPADDRRQERLQEARQWLAVEDGDDSWLEDEDAHAPKLLVLVHRMAAIRLGFPRLYSALNDSAPEDLRSGLVDGTAWVLRPFLSYVLPLLLARQEEREFEIMRLLLKHCPRLQADRIAACDAAAELHSLQNDITELIALLDPAKSNTIGDVLTFLCDRGLLTLEDRYRDLVETYAESDPVKDFAEENSTLRFMQCEAKELLGYRRYIEKLSPFATQQGIKGAEFVKVIVVVDDQEGKSPTFSYGKYFGVTAFSKTDNDNIAAGKDSVIDRTRRLFYVCCSRALSDLAVVIFSEDTKQMREAILVRGFFDSNDVHVLN